MDDEVYISGAFSHINGTLMRLEDKARIIEMLFRMSKELGIGWQGRIGYAHEFILDQFTTDGPSE